MNALSRLSRSPQRQRIATCRQGAEFAHRHGRIAAQTSEPGYATDRPRRRAARPAAVGRAVRHLGRAVATGGHVDVPRPDDGPRGTDGVPVLAGAKRSDEMQPFNSARLVFSVASWEKRELSFAELGDQFASQREHSLGGAKWASVASVVGRGQDQTRKNRACLAQRCAG